MTPPTRVRRPPPLSGRALRFVLVDQIREQGTMTVAEMVSLVTSYGYEVPGRPSKVISDALRWEVARGRVVRVARGSYAYGRVPRTTARRIRLFARSCHAWIVAVTRRETPPPTPPTPQHRWTRLWWFPEDPLRPPWDGLYWLWAT